MDTSSWKDRGSEFIEEVERLGSMLSTEEVNTPLTFQNAIQVAVDCKFIDKKILCKKFGLTQKGLEMWIGRNKYSYMPASWCRPKIFKFIYDQMIKPT